MTGYERVLRGTANRSAPWSRQPKACWNGYQVIGPKLPFKLNEILAVRIRFQIAGRVRDPALFDFGIDSKLRGSDLVKLRFSEVTIG